MTDYSKHEIEAALINTATNPEFADTVKDYAELGIDAIFNSEIVDAIPVVKSISAILKGVATIQDRMFLKKLATFLSAANNLTESERMHGMKSTFAAIKKPRLRSATS